MPVTPIAAKCEPAPKQSGFGAKYKIDKITKEKKCTQPPETKGSHPAPVQLSSTDISKGQGMGQIKSKERVRDLAEVYTNEREVNNMLDLVEIKRPSDIITYRYLEPSCGNGNFLLEILSRKLSQINKRCKGRSLSNYELLVVKAVSSIYGIEICPENVREAIARMATYIKGNFDVNYGSYLYSEGFIESVLSILETNIVVGDAINQPESIEFTEFKFKGRNVSRLVFNFHDLITQKKPTPIRTFEIVNFLNLSPSISKRQLELEL